MVMILGGALVPVQAFLFPATAFASFVLLELGVAIVGLGAVASFRPRDRTAIGAAVAPVGGVSLAYGGRFVIGAILTILGGVLLVDARDLSLRYPPVPDPSPLPPSAPLARAAGGTLRLGPRPVRTAASQTPSSVPVH
jgi:hypothetical protein